MSLYLICELYIVFLAYFEMMSNWMVCESWITTLFVNVFLSQQVWKSQQKMPGVELWNSVFFVSLGVWNSILHHQLLREMVQPPSKTNLDPLLRAYALFLSSTCFFLHILKWCPIEWCVNLEIRPFLLMCFCPNRLKVPNRQCQGLSCGIQFFLFHWGSEMVFCIISCWENGSTSK